MAKTAFVEFYGAPYARTSILRTNDRCPVKGYVKWAGLPPKLLWVLSTPLSIYLEEIAGSWQSTPMDVFVASSSARPKQDFVHELLLLNSKYKH
jgi:hypothetical protein